MTFSAEEEYNLVLLGCKNSGKSALICKLISGRFIHLYASQIEATYKYCLSGDDDAYLSSVVQVKITDSDSAETNTSKYFRTYVEHVGYSTFWKL